MNIVFKKGGTPADGPINNRKWLKRMYVDNQLSTWDVAALAGCSQWTVRDRLHRFGIPIRSCSEGNVIKWKDPEYIEKQEFTPERRRNHKKGWTKERKTAHRKTLKKLWKDPNYRKMQIDRMSGENNPRWDGGRYRPYTKEWTHEFREYIRRRDRYTCALCGAKQTTKRLDVHHINYVKADTVPENCISLCRPCHMAISRSTKEYWNDVLCDIMDARGL